MTRRTWLLLGGAGLAAGGAAWVTRHPTTTPALEPLHTSAPDLVIEPQELDFGTTWEADRFVRALTVRNRADAPRVVRSMSGSCSCQSFTPSTFTIPPGGSQVVRMELNLHSQLPRSAPKPEEEFAASLWADVSGQEQPTYWRACGRVRRTLQAPERINLGAVSDRTPAAAATTVPVRVLAGRLESLSAAAPGAWVRATVLPGTRPDVFALTVVPGAGLERRAYTTAVVLTPVLATGEALPEVRIPVAFEVGAEVQAVPTAVDLGAREVGSEARDTVALRAVGGRPFRVVAVRASDPGLTARLLARDGLTVYELVRTVTAAGPFDDRLTFDVEADGEAFAVVVPVRGHGYAGGPQ